MASNSFLTVDVDVRPFAELCVDTPFGGKTVNISKAEYIQLKWEASYWHKQFARLSTHRERDVQRLGDEMARRDVLAARAYGLIKAELEKVQAQVKDFQKRLFGQKSEKSRSECEKRADKPPVKRARGQPPGSPGHGRVRPTNLPGVVEPVDVPETDRCCARCRMPSVPCPTPE